MTDSDMDGMPDAYESLHGLSNGLDDADDDKDGDGDTNITEMRAGSDPQSVLSRVRPLRIVLTTDGVDVFMDDPRPGKSYRIEFSDDLAAWRTLDFGLFDTPTDSDPGRIIAKDRGASGRQRRFYRAVIEP
jgi:hypothetical protein